MNTLDRRRLLTAAVGAGKNRDALMTCHNQKRMSGFAVTVLVCCA